MSIQWTNTANGTAFLAPHMFLRVTFAAEPPFFLSRETAQLNLAADVARLVQAGEDGYLPIAPASATDVPPNVSAFTIDFVNPSDSSQVRVSDAIAALAGQMFGGLEFIHSTVIQRVELVAPPSPDDLGSGVFGEGMGQTTQDVGAQAEAEHPGVLSGIESAGKWLAFAALLGVGLYAFQKGRK